VQAHALGINPALGGRPFYRQSYDKRETELPSLKLLVDRRRCIIPADGFYEWQQRRKAQGPDVGASEDQAAFRLSGIVGRMAQAGWEAGGVVHDHHHGAQ
jgi:putative SOS response-associated peptidase YedK